MVRARSSLRRAPSARASATRRAAAVKMACGIQRLDIIPESWNGRGIDAGPTAASPLLHVLRVEARVRPQEVPAMSEGIDEPSPAAVGLVLQRTLDPGTGGDGAFERRVHVVHVGR